MAVLEIVKEIRCRENDDKVVIILAAGGTIEFSKRHIAIFEHPDAARWLAETRHPIIDWATLELNTKDMTIDIVVFDPERFFTSSFSVGVISWNHVNQEFLDALFCANQRLRSFLV